MVRKQVYLEYAQDLMVKNASQGRGTTEAQIIREAIDCYLTVSRDQIEDPLIQLIGIVDSTKSDGSIMHDRHLYTEQGDEYKE